MNKYERRCGNVTLFLDLAERITLRSALRLYLAAIESGKLNGPTERVKEMIELVTPAGFDIGNKEGKQ